MLCNPSQGRGGINILGELVDAPAPPSCRMSERRRRFRSRAADRAAGCHRRQLSHLSPHDGAMCGGRGRGRGRRHGMGAQDSSARAGRGGLRPFLSRRLEEGIALRKLVPRGAHLRAGWRASRRGARASHPSPDTGAQQPGRNRGVERGGRCGAHQPGCGGACRYRH